MQKAEILDFDVAKLTGDHVRVMEKFAKYDKAQVEAHFDGVADNYEGAYLRAGYPDPQQCADYVSDFAKKLGLSKDAPIVALSEYSSPPKNGLAKSPMLN